EDDRAEPPLERGRARLEIDLGLPAASRPLEQQVLADTFVECREHPPDGRLLLVRQPFRLGLSCERLPQGRRGPLAARASAGGGEELQGASGGRARTVREPQ